MKVKVKRRTAQNWPEICKILPTPILEAIIDVTAQGNKVPWELGSAAAEEHYRRRRLRNPAIKTTAESWLEFQRHYMLRVPSFHGGKCPGLGDTPGYECQCDECEHYLTCFPDWKENQEQP